MRLALTLLLTGALALASCSGGSDGDAAPADARRIAETALEREAAVVAEVVASRRDGDCAAVAFVTESSTGHYVVVLRLNGDEWKPTQIADADKDDEGNLRQTARRSGYCRPSG
jgi:hypothetical protein